MGSSTTVVTSRVKEIYDLSGKTARKTTVYTFSVPRYVYVQITGAAAPAKILADKFEVEGGINDGRLILKRGDEEIGSFRRDCVVGWWYQDEHSTT